MPPSLQPWLVEGDEQASWTEAEPTSDVDDDVSIEVTASLPLGTPLSPGSTIITYTAVASVGGSPLPGVISTCQTVVEVIVGQAVSVETLGLLTTAEDHREVAVAGSTIAGNTELFPRLSVELLSRSAFAFAVQAPPNLEFLINLDQVAESTGRIVVSAIFCTAGFEETNADNYDQEVDLGFLTFASSEFQNAGVSISTDYAFLRLRADPNAGACVWLDAATNEFTSNSTAGASDGIAFFQMILVVSLPAPLPVPTTFGDFFPLEISSMFFAIQRM